MSAHSFIRIGERLLRACREGYDPNVAAMFNETDLRASEEGYEYVVSARQMRQRLQVLGFTSARALAELDSSMQAWHRREDPEDDLFEDLLDGLKSEDMSMLRARFAEYLTSTDLFSPYQVPKIIDCLDPRFLMRLAVDLVPDSTEVAHELSYLIGEPYLQPGIPIADIARKERGQSRTDDGPLVVLTEGSTDARALAAGMLITHPHLEGFIQFMDVHAKAEMNVAALDKMVRIFSTARISHRVLALADNDAAAHRHLARLKKDLKSGHIPENYRILHYPDIPLLRAYPVERPDSGNAVEDVNGWAGSLEMYLGENLLLDRNGQLIPVQQKGEPDGPQQLQGTLPEHHKRRINKAFMRVAKRAKTDPVVRAEHDWGGVGAIIEAVAHSFD